MSKSNDNFKKLWNERKTPATGMVTDFPGQLSSINSYYMLEQATEAFGPCGKGWVTQ